METPPDFRSFANEPPMALFHFPFNCALANRKRHTPRLTDTFTPMLLFKYPKYGMNTHEISQGSKTCVSLDIIEVTVQILD